MFSTIEEIRDARPLATLLAQDALAHATQMLQLCVQHQKMTALRRKARLQFALPGQCATGQVELGSALFCLHQSATIPA
jgi:uncharacterized protein (DUF2345 family)